MSSFTTNEQHAQDFYDKSKGLINTHNDIYKQYIHTLNDPTGVLGTMTNNLDDFIAKTSPEFDEFRKSVNSDVLHL